MIQRSNRSNLASRHHPMLDDILEELTEKIQNGAPIDLEEYARRYPAHAEQIRRLVPALAVLAELGHTAVRDAALPGMPSAAGVGPGLESGVLGDYRIIREVGRGGMGVVYEAEQISLGRRVALKVMPFAAALDSRQLQRFTNEAKAAAHLHHTNIVPVFSVGCERGVHYYAMQFIDGWTLAEVMRDLRTLSDLERHPRPDENDGALAPASGLASGQLEPAQRLKDRDPKTETPASPKGEPAAPNEVLSSVKTTGSSTRTRAFFRTAARMGVQAAEALEHAHRQEIVHRDIKPANLLVDVDGNLWITDFGLARVRGEAGVTMTGDLPGTLRYMSPEQARGRPAVVDHRTDIYSLGVTLYELLTLRPAIEGVDRQEMLRRVEDREPIPPRRLNPALPRELETIVLKAMSKDPEGRYQTAEALADDLRRFLDNKPIHARRPTLLDRASKWARRNLAVVAASFVVLLVAVALLAASVILITREQRKAIAAAQDSRYESLVQNLLRILWTPHRHGWSDDAKRTIDAMAGIREDDRLRSLAVAARKGLDAHIADSIAPGGQAILFDRSGGRLLISSIANDGFRGENRGTRVWDLAARAQDVTKIRGNGPVAFRGDETPLQLVHDDLKTLRLWDIARESVVTEFTIPITEASNAAGANDRSLVFHDMAMALDGSRVAASVKDPDGHAWVFVWDGDSGRLRHRFTGHAERLAFSPDGALLAGGADAGKIHVWSTLDGVEVSSPRQGRLTVSSLAFGRNLRRVPEMVRGNKSNGRGWWLAAGDAGGNVTVWDVETGMLHVRCPGGVSGVEAIAFSPDGTVLVAVGTGHAILWDVASGTLLLNLGHPDHCLGLAFSPDGRRLAISTAELVPRVGSNDLSQVVIRRIENGRGIQTFRGLITSISQIRFSPDGQYVAALASDWRVAIWDRQSGALRHVLEPPEGSTSDNAALAFSRDGARFAIASGRDATLWDVGSGRELGSWSLPLGLCDLLALPPSGQLLLCRVETTSGERGPSRDAPYEQYPRVCRIRELLDAGRMRTIAEITAFNRHVFSEVAPDDLSYIVVDGVSIDASETRRSITAFHATTGKQLWSVPIPSGPSTSVSLHLDPTGQVLGVGQGYGTECDLFRMPVGTRVDSLRDLESLGPRAAVWIARNRPSTATGNSYLVLRRGDDRPVLTLGAEAMPSIAGQFRFSGDGSGLAWANSDGTIDVADLNIIQRGNEMRPHGK